MWKLDSIQKLEAETLPNAILMVYPLCDYPFYHLSVQAYSLSEKRNKTKNNKNKEPEQY